VVGGGGGGVLSSYGIMTITNSTLSGNFTHRGGGVWSYGATTTISNSTVSGNAATITGAELYTAGYSGSLIVQHSLLGHDRIRNAGAFGGFSPDASNIIATKDSNNATALANILSPLADNGGATQTHALPTGSPAIDAGDSTSCPATDQRGAPRVLVRLKFKIR